MCRRISCDAPGDVLATYADVDDLARDVGFAPYAAGRGHGEFVEWYRPT